MNNNRRICQNFHHVVCFGQNNEEKARLHDKYNSRIQKPLRPKRKRDAIS
jgi:hypothetical protein